MSYSLVRKAAPSVDPYAPCVHEDCIYRADPRVSYGCNYSDITGRSRIGQHGPGDNSPAHCKLYEPGERIKISRREVFENKENNNGR